MSQDKLESAYRNSLSEASKANLKTIVSQVVIAHIDEAKLGIHPVRSHSPPSRQESMAIQCKMRPM
jgi:hypothetical protein